MALIDNSTLLAAKGFAFRAPVGTPKPTPAEIAAFDGSTFGSQVQNLTITGLPTGGTFTLTVDTQTTTALPYNATGSQIQAALAALSSVGLGNVKAEGVALPTGPVAVTWIGALQGETHTITATASLTGGTTPAVVVTQAKAASSWVNLGHTSKEDMPEWGFDGGSKELKGSWQNKRLRRVQTDPFEDFVTLKLLQFTEDALALYYGPNGTTDAGYFDVVEVDNVTNEFALLIVIVDGNEKLGFHALKADISRDDAIATPIDELASLPIKATFLQINGQPVYSWIDEDAYNVA